MIKYLPDWADALFHESLDHLHELREILDLSVAGVSALTGTADLVEALIETGHGGGRGPEDIERARMQASLADREVTNDFPILHAQTALLVWSTVEHLVVSFVTETLRRTPSKDLPESIRKARIRAGEFLDLSEDDRPLLLLSALEHELAAPLRQGVGRFESLLAPFDLSGPVPEPIRICLFELQQVRNVHVHRRGKADPSVIEACPWLKLQKGQYIAISRADVQRYFSAALGYVTLLIRRLSVRHGDPDLQRLDELLDRFAKTSGRRPDEQLPLERVDGTLRPQFGADCAGDQPPVV